MQFFIALFTMAGLSGLFILIGKSLKSRPKLELKNILWGILFGIPNFFSLFYFLEALKIYKTTGNTSIVFPLVSMGVVVISAVIGIVFFREKLSKGNWIGILFALASIAVFHYKRCSYLTYLSIREYLQKKGSSLIGIAFPCDSENDFTSKLKEIKIKYNDSRHHCFAYKLKPDGSQTVSMTMVNHPIVQVNPSLVK